MPRPRSFLLVIPLLFLPLAAATPKLDAVAPVLFELESGARYASTDLRRWEIFTRHGVQIAPGVSLEFIGADYGMTLAGQAKGTPTLSLFHGNDPARWRPHCASYDGVIYRGLYPGIDLIYRRLAGRLKGDFIVQPGADPRLIRFRFKGADVQVERDRLAIRSPHETLEERIPSVYEDAAGNRVEAHYHRFLDGSIGFAVEGHDPKRKLTIDPDLAFSTYVAGSMLDEVTAMVYSPLETMLLVTGWTESGDLLGATASTFKGSTDGYYGRFTVSGAGTVGLSSMTLFGGTGMDKGLAIAVSPAGAVAIGGSTSSTNFPTLFPYQSHLKGTSDGFLLRFPVASSTFASATYLGGTGTDQVYGVAIDANNTIFFAGTTSSRDLLTTTGAQQLAFAGGSTDGFAGSMSSAASPLYLTYLGGTGNDSIAGLALLNGEVYVTGATDSVDYPTRNAYQAISGGGQDAFVTKLNSSGLLSYSTYLGGNGGYAGSPEMATAIAVDSLGEAYVTGMTSSTNFPVLNAAQAQSNFRYGVTDAFLSKFTAAGTLSFSTFWGGSSWEQSNALVILPSGYVAIGGMTSSLDFPVQAPVGSGPAPAPPLYDGSVYNGNYDAFVAVFSPTGVLYWSTYLGGAGTDSAAALATNLTGEIFAGGSTGSYNFPKVSALQSTISGSGYHGFLTRIALPKAQYGLFRSSSGTFFLVRNVDFLPSGITKVQAMDWSNVCPPGTANTEAIPVVGDWDNTGRPRLGLFRVSTGTWYLDMNGDDLYTPGVDQEVDNFGTGAYPVAGDWDNTGRVRLGYFTGGAFFMDMNNDHVFSYSTDQVKPWGFAGDIPLVGDWTNTGKQRIGVYHQGFWFLDLRGDFVANQGITAIMGATTDNPVFADWGNIGIKRIGNYRTFGYPIGFWFADINNHYAWEGGPGSVYIFGGTGDTAVTGIRSH